MKLFTIVTKNWVYEMCSQFLHIPERNLKYKGWPEGKTWIAGMKKIELKKLGLEVFDTCNCNGKWHYLVDEDKAIALLKQEK